MNAVRSTPGEMPQDGLRVATLIAIGLAVTSVLVILQDPAIRIHINRIAQDPQQLSKLKQIGAAALNSLGQVLLHTLEEGVVN